MAGNSFSGSVSDEWARLFVDELSGPLSVPSYHVFTTQAAADRLKEIQERYCNSAFNDAFLRGSHTSSNRSESLMGAGLGFLRRVRMFRDDTSKDAALDEFEFVGRLASKSDWDRRDKLYAMIAESTLVSDAKRKEDLLRSAASSAGTWDPQIASVATVHLVQALRQAGRAAEASSISAKARNTFAEFANYTYYGEFR